MMAGSGVHRMHSVATKADWNSRTWKAATHVKWLVDGVVPAEYLPQGCISRCW